MSISRLVRENRVGLRATIVVEVIGITDPISSVFATDAGREGGDIDAGLSHVDDSGEGVRLWALVFSPCVELVGHPPCVGRERLPLQVRQVAQLLVEIAGYLSSPGFNTGSGSVLKLIVVHPSLAVKVLPDDEAESVEVVDPHPVVSERVAVQHEVGGSCEQLPHYHVPSRVPQLVQG